MKRYSQDENIIDYGLTRVGRFCQLSRQQNRLNAVVTIESVEEVDRVGEFLAIRVNASILGEATYITFMELTDDAGRDNYAVGSAWRVYGRYRIDWDCKCIELMPAKTERLSEASCWASNYARQNNLSVQKHFFSDVGSELI